MFNYLFPIFGFGIVITGIVALGIIEAISQAKADSARADEREPGDDEIKITPAKHPPVLLSRSQSQ